jgi:hypothetical protein
MRKDLQKESASSCSKSSSRKAKETRIHSPENRPQRTHDDLRKAEKNALGIDSSIIDSTLQ